MKRLLLPLLALTALTCPAQRIAILSDIHVTPGSPNDRQLRLAVADINASGADVVVVDGDLSNEGSDEQLANVKEILDGIAMPLYVIPGNHENNWSQSATMTFPRIWDADRFVGEVGDLVLVGINCGPFMKMGDGHIKQEDLHWLDSTLAERATEGKRVVSFCHYALNPDLDNYQAYIDIVGRYPVIAQINGHYHQYRRYWADDVEGLWVRALDMRNGDYGYTIMDVDPEWIRVYEKHIGQPEELRFVFPAVTSHRVRPVKDATAWQQPEGFEVTRVWADSASVFTRVAVDKNNVYFGTSTGRVKAVDKASGSLAWQIATDAGSMFSRPAVLSDGTVAVPSPKGILLVAPDGNEVTATISTSAPYMADGLVAGGRYLQGGYYAFDCYTDAPKPELVWRYDSIGNYCQAAPVVDGNDLIFGAWDTNLRCLDVRDGSLRWAWNNGKPANMLGPGNVVPVVVYDKVIIVAPDRYMTAIDRRTGETLWRDNSHKYRESLGRSADGTRAYAKTMDGELVAVDTTSPQFRELWTLDMGLGYEHAPCIVLEHDGVVYAGSRRGLVTAVDPVSQSVLWQLPLGVSEINGFDVDTDTGDVYLSLIEGTVYRIRKL